MTTLLDSPGLQWLKKTDAQVRPMESTNIYTGWEWKDRDDLWVAAEGSGWEKAMGAGQNSLK